MGTGTGGIGSKGGQATGRLAVVILGSGSADRSRPDGRFEERREEGGDPGKEAGGCTEGGGEEREGGDGTEVLWLSTRFSGVSGARKRVGGGRKAGGKDGR